MTLGSDDGDRLVSASTNIAETAELHETTAEDGSMAMQQVDGIEIPAGGEAVLEPGGFHVMLVDVTEELAEGDTVDLTLVFENAGEQAVSAEVVPTGDQPPMEMGSESMEMSSEG
jgi:copper(I)-binding protein